MKASRVHRISPPDFRRRKHEQAPDYLASGRAWARVQLLYDGRVVIDGKRGGVTLDEDHGKQLAAMLNLMGVRERR